MARPLSSKGVTSTSIVFDPDGLGSDGGTSLVCNGEAIEALCGQELDAFLLCVD